MEDPVFKRAIVKSIKAYFNDKTPAELGKLRKMRYTKKYFDRFEENEFGSVSDKMGDHSEERY